MVKESLRPGLSRTNRIEVDSDRTIGFMGEEGASTARLSGARYRDDLPQLILDHADAGRGSVGTDVAIQHLRRRCSACRLRSRSP